MDAGRRRHCRTSVLLAAAVALSLAGTAPAATVERTTFGTQVTDDSSNTNTLEIELVGGQVRVTDTTQPPTSMTCDVNGNTATCPASDLHDVFVDAGPADDIVTLGNGIVGASINGGAGLDELNGADGADSLLGGSERDIIKGGAGTDQIEGGDGNDDLRGGPGNDFFNLYVTDDQAQVLDTDAGNDTLDGEDGSDSLNGGRGGDVMTDTGTDGAKDEVHYGRGDHESAVGVTVTIANGRNDGNSADQVFDDVGAGIEQVVGTARNDELTGSDKADTLRGGSGDDRLNGGGAADTLTGGAGNDTLEAREGTADASLDCDDTTGSQGTSDNAIVDAADPAPVRCEVVDRPATNTPPPNPTPTPTPAPTPAQTTGPQPPRTAGRPTIARAGTVLTCQPGAWSAVPTFTYAWFVVGTALAPVKLADGQTYKTTDADEGRLVFCLVVARSNGGTAVARSVLLSVPTLVRMPELQFRPEATAREKVLKITKGAVRLQTKRSARRDISCALGGSKGTDAECATKAARKARRDLDPGDVYITSPKDGRVLEADVATGELPRVRLSVYDRSLDDKLPPTKPGKFGNDCPLTGPGFTPEDRRAFIAGLQGKYESVARATLDKRECLFKIKDDFRRDQESDPWVTAIENVEIDKKNGLRLTIARNRQPDLVVIPYHRRLQGLDRFAGADISQGSRINPGLGNDGKLTTLFGDLNDVCFQVREASTGRPVPGVAVRATDPNGRIVVDRVSLADQGGNTDANGNRCDRWRIDEVGEYRFTFDYRGDNGVNAEGWLRIDAVKRVRESFTTIAGRRLECVVDRCIQIGNEKPVARQAVVVESVILVAVVAVLVRGVIAANGRGTDQADAARTAQALSGGDPEVSLHRAAGNGGVTPGFMTNGGKLAPGAGIVAGGAGNIISGGGGNIISGGAGNVVSAGAGNIVAGGAGNLVATDGSSVKVPAGGSLTALGGVVAGGAGNLLANDGASVVSAGAGNLLANDGASVVSAGAGNLVARGGDVVQIGERTVITDKGTVPVGTLIATGAAGGIPVSPIVSGGAGNLIGQDGSG